MKILFLTVCAVLFLPNLVTACSYAGSPNVPFSYFIAKTNIIFLAEVAEKRTVLKTIEGEKVPVHYYKIDVVERIKGKTRQSLRFHFSDIRRSSCDSKPPSLKIGEKWIIFGDYDEGQGAYLSNFRGQLYNRWINHSKTPGRYKEILKLVKNPVTTIEGEIDKTDNAGFTSIAAKSVEVSIEGEKFRSKTRTDDEGRYVFKALPAGRYKITIRLDFTAYNIMELRQGEMKGESEFVYEVTIREGDSEYKYFDFQKFPIENLP